MAAVAGATGGAGGPPPPGPPGPPGGGPPPPGGPPGWSIFQINVDDGWLAQQILKRAGKKYDDQQVNAFLISILLRGGLRQNLDGTLTVNGDWDLIISEFALRGHTICHESAMSVDLSLSLSLFLFLFLLIFLLVFPFLCISYSLAFIGLTLG